MIEIWEQLTLPLNCASKFFYETKWLQDEDRSEAFHGAKRTSLLQKQL
jgi:hypothetical protein